MIVCANCGVELEDDMKVCPLCDTPAGQAVAMWTGESQTHAEQGDQRRLESKPLLQRVLWQVTSILLLSGIISTLVIDLAVHKTMTWSVYPVTICMIVFCYASLFAFSQARRVYQFVAGLLISAALLLLLDVVSQARWPLELALPILGAANLVTILMIVSAARAKHRGLNVIAYICVGIAVLCMAIECILSLYNGKIVLRWSVIVAACMLPVTAALLFMHHKIRNNPAMQKIFHT